MPKSYSLFVTSAIQRKIAKLRFGPLPARAKHPGLPAPRPLAGESLSPQASIPPPRPSLATISLPHPENRSATGERLPAPPVLGTRHPRPRIRRCRRPSCSSSRNEPPREALRPPESATGHRRVCVSRERAVLGFGT